jgi:hypothetical protein
MANVNGTGGDDFVHLTTVHFVHFRGGCRLAGRKADAA